MTAGIQAVAMAYISSVVDSGRGSAGFLDNQGSRTHLSHLSHCTFSKARAARGHLGDTCSGGAHSSGHSCQLESPRILPLPRRRPLIALGPRSNRLTPRTRSPDQQTWKLPGAKAGPLTQRIFTQEARNEGQQSQPSLTWCHDSRAASRGVLCSSRVRSSLSAVAVALSTCFRSLKVSRTAAYSTRGRPTMCA